MNLNNTPSRNLSITIFSTQLENDDTLTLKELKGKDQTAALEAIAKNQFGNFVFKKDNEYFASEELYNSGRKFVIQDESGRKTSLEGRVRVMNEADVAEIKAFANQYFAKMKEKEEKREGKVGEKRSWQPVMESDKKKGEAARKAIARANEREEESTGEVNRNVENKANLETGKKIRRFYDKMKTRNDQIEEFHKQTRDNKIN